MCLYSCMSCVYTCVSMCMCHTLLLLLSLECEVECPDGEVDSLGMGLADVEQKV